MLLNSHISAYARCIADKVCGLVRSTWGTSQGEDEPGARDKILNAKVARRAPGARWANISNAPNYAAPASDDPWQSLDHKRQPPAALGPRRLPTSRGLCGLWA